MHYLFALHVLRLPSYHDQIQSYPVLCEIAKSSKEKFVLQSLDKHYVITNVVREQSSVEVEVVVLAWANDVEPSHRRELYTQYRLVQGLST